MENRYSNHIDTRRRRRQTVSPFRTVASVLCHVRHFVAEKRRGRSASARKKQTLSSKTIEIDDFDPSDNRVMSSFSIVHLNVGGTPYCTSIATLARDPDCMLARMIEQDRESALIRDGKELFIDRNGRLFEYVLDYLRNGDQTVLPSDECTLRALQNEADFFQLSSMEKMIAAKLQAVQDDSQLRNANAPLRFRPGEYVRFRQDVCQSEQFINDFLQKQIGTGNSRCWACKKMLSGNKINMFRDFGFQYLIGYVDKIVDTNTCVIVHFPIEYVRVAAYSVNAAESSKSLSFHAPCAILERVA